MAQGAGVAVRRQCRGSNPFEKANNLAPDENWGLLIVEKSRSVLLSGMTPFQNFRGRLETTSCNQYHEGENFVAMSETCTRCGCMASVFAIA
jgi:hypothetical protein